MFEEFMGIPAHPLLVHVPVVLVPLLAILAVVYALLPVVRPHTRWVLGLLAVAGPISALFAKLSGDAFFARMDAAGDITAGFYPTIEEHQQLGNFTLGTTVALGIVTLALVYLIRPGSPAMRTVGGQTMTNVVSIGLRVLTVLAAAAALYYVIRTGDTGAKAVWTGR